MPTAHQDAVVSPKALLPASVQRTAAVLKLTRQFGLRVGQQHELTIRRLKRGDGYSFVSNGRTIKDPATLSRLKSLRAGSGILHRTVSGVSA